MSQAIELQLPAEILERAEQTAKESNRSIEEVLLEGLRLQFEPIEPLDIERRVLALTDDELLWGFINLTWELESKYFRSGISDLSKLYILTAAEQANLKKSLQIVERCTQLRPIVREILKQRGWEVD